MSRGGPAAPEGGGRWIATEPPQDDDIPLPPEPPADEPPPEDDFDSHARPSAGPPSEGASAGAASAGTAPPRSSTSRYAALRAAMPTTSERAPSSISLPEDEPSADDPDVEGSGLVGPSVVAQLLGGRVIEERAE